MIHSKPIEGRPLPLELIHEMNKFMPLNGLIKCAQANRTLNDLGIPRARKVHTKLISLYFADISTLAIWLRQWASQAAEVRAKIHRQTSNPDQFPDLIWIILLVNDFREIRNLFQQFSDKTIEIVKAGRVDNILAGFNFPPAFQNELRQIRAFHVEKALAPVKFKLSQWRLENVPILDEMLTHFRGILSENSFKQFNNKLHWHFSQITGHANSCEIDLKMMAKHLNLRS